MEINGFMKALMAVIIAVIMVVLVAVPILTGFTEVGPGETAENNTWTGQGGRVGYITLDMPLEVVCEVTPDTSVDVFTINGVPAQIHSYSTELTCYFYFENGGAIAIKNGDIGVRDKGSQPVYWGKERLVITEGEVYLDSSKKEGFSNPRGVFNVSCEAFDGMQLYGLIENDVQFFVNEGTVCYDYAIGRSAVAVEGEVTMTDIGGSGTSATPIIFTSEGNYLSATWTYALIVPVEYYTTPSTPAQVSGAVADLIDVVPLIMVVGVVVATVGVFLVRYRT